MSANILNTYQLNSIMYDIIGEFAADNDNINENTYMDDFGRYVHYYCMEHFTEEDAGAILVDTYTNVSEYLEKSFGSSFGDYTLHQTLQLILIDRLLDPNNGDLHDLVCDDKLDEKNKSQDE